MKIEDSTQNCEVTYKRIPRIMPFFLGARQAFSPMAEDSIFAKYLTIICFGGPNGTEKIRSSLRDPEPDHIVRQRENTLRGGRRRKARALKR